MDTGMCPTKKISGFMQDNGIIRLDDGRYLARIDEQSVKYNDIPEARAEPSDEAPRLMDMPIETYIEGQPWKPGHIYMLSGDDLIKHDANHTPTQWAYDQACSALKKHKSELEAERARGEELRKTPSVDQILAWMRIRPGESWVATIRDVEQARAALSAHPQSVGEEK